MWGSQDPSIFFGQIVFSPPVWHWHTLSLTSWQSHRSKNDSGPVAFCPVSYGSDRTVVSWHSERYCHLQGHTWTPQPAGRKLWTRDGSVFLSRLYSFTGDEKMLLDYNVDYLNYYNIMEHTALLKANRHTLQLSWSGKKHQRKGLKRRKKTSGKRDGEMNQRWKSK